MENGTKKIESKIEPEQDNKWHPVMEVLNACETAILRFGKENRNLGIKNVYWFMADLLGFKSKNHLYQIFEERDETKLQYKHLLEIVRITKDKDLVRAIIKDAKEAYRE